MKTIEVPERILTSMLLCAFRYALGRQTYIVSECCDWLKLYWVKMPEGWQKQIHDDILHAIEKGYVGHQCDINSWSEILKLKVKNER
jgi:hypothetical protein